MCDKRRRLHSSMTYDEFLEFTTHEPQAPLLKPIKDSPVFVPELELTSKSLMLLEQEDEFKEDLIQGQLFKVPKTFKHIKKRVRYHSENAPYTFLNIMERSIQSRKATKVSALEYRI